MEQLGAIAKEFLGQGLSGAVALLAIIAFWREKTKNEVLQEKRVEMVYSFATAYQKFAEEMGSTLDEVLDALDRGGGRFRTRPRGYGFDVPTED